MLITSMSILLMLIPPVNIWIDIMKQLIILLATILLGAALFSMIAGDSPKSTKSVLKNVWQQEMQVKTLQGVK